MNKCVSILVVLSLIAAGSVCILFVHQDDVRSDATPLTPYITIDSSAEGTMMIGDETYPYIIADAAFGVDLIQDDRSHCWASLSFARSNFGPYNNLEFEFWSMSGTLVPEGSVWMSTSGNESKYTYDDPLTGTKLTFHILNDVVDWISFEGTTMNEFDGKLEYVTFGIKASFENNVVYVNNVMEGPLPEARTLYISGEENGRPMSGTLNIVPLSCNIWNGGYERVMAQAMVDVIGTSIPDSILNAVVELSDGNGFIDQGLHMQYLDREGNYIVQDVTFELSGGEEQILVLEGTITSSAIVSDCEIVEQNRLEFSYKVVA